MDQGFGIRSVLLIISDPDSANTQHERVNDGAPDRERAERERVPDPARGCQRQEQQDQQDARRDGRPLEVGHLARLRGHGLGRDVVSRQPADPAGDEVEEDHLIEEAAQAHGVAETGGSNPEADHVGQRVELAAERGGPMAPPRDPPVDHVEHQRQHDQRAGRVDLRRPCLAHVRHREEDGGGAAAAVRQREEVGQMERAKHGEVPRALAPILDWTHAAFLRSRNCAVQSTLAFLGLAAEPGQTCRGGIRRPASIAVKRAIALRRGGAARSHPGASWCGCPRTDRAGRKTVSALGTGA